ncbi:tRNA epoxyqueuosine(34) reductase QueG [Rugamonas sp. CCM 8940]|uniref:tRNA epoxyqueuosine(34) reductase QueG n=1 Tax=Rugamonas sp. CCM 8940 TaxID=2765359 RepID=UPI0018F66FD8|nr:tRNA epoxyqueuosine(34) reductase QueG [Rugamonas sp. CCM 8940]MBJ7311341.1 tRNA epoxyqueuosine(34) reductase QueG [Rugamonas sp. CCM 8940]
MSLSESKLAELAARIKQWGVELGFAELRIADIDLRAQEAGLQAWLDAGMHGEMDYMASHGMKRARPDELVPGTVRVICARMNYLPQAGGAAAVAAALDADADADAEAPGSWRAAEAARLADPGAAVISVYARGRDYHKVLRARLQQLADRIRAESGEFGYRVFTDSAPVMELPLAQKSGLGWRGKHTLLINRDGGSLFFMGEILVDIPLPVDEPVSAHCGGCSACITACPTQAILGPGRLDARRCISYLTIESKSAIPLELRPLIGNRVYGCDDCQSVCPWNKFAQRAVLPDFDERHGLGSASLVELFGWSEEEFNRKMEGSPIRRIGHVSWLRNLAVGMGNAAAAGAKGDQAIVAALLARREHESALVREHVEWALACHR